MILNKCPACRAKNVGQAIKGSRWRMKCRSCKTIYSNDPRNVATGRRIIQIGPNMHKKLFG